MMKILWQNTVMIQGWYL